MTQITENSAYSHYTINVNLNTSKIKIPMIPQPSPDDPHFIQAAEEWDLDRLYLNLKDCISEKLTDREKIILRGLLCDYAPKEIAKIAYGKDTSEPIASNLTNLYEILTHLNAHQSSHPAKIDSNNIRRILKSLGYHKSSLAHTDVGVASQNGNRSSLLLETAS